MRFFLLSHVSLVDDRWLPRQFIHNEKWIQSPDALLCLSRVGRGWLEGREALVTEASHREQTNQVKRGSSDKQRHMAYRTESRSLPVARRIKFRCFKAAC